jgi:tryptophan synthase alpha chain
MNRIEKLFSKKNKRVLSVYFTAGYPQLSDTIEIIKELDRSGADLIEIGMPFSDPVADGPVIQKSSEKALLNGMSIKLLFEQLAEIRKVTEIPLILMGYINPIYRFGIEEFLVKCNETGIDGTIIPDLPAEEYLTYEPIFKKYNISNVFLISPHTPPERLLFLDSLTNGFIYMVSSSSTTGGKNQFSEDQTAYFEQTIALRLKAPLMIGFGISDKESFDQACNYANGAIIGSAFIRALDNKGTIQQRVSEFLRQITG